MPAFYRFNYNFTHLAKACEANASDVTWSKVTGHWMTIHVNGETNTKVFWQIMTRCKSDGHILSAADPGSVRSKQQCLLWFKSRGQILKTS